MSRNLLQWTVFLCALAAAPCAARAAVRGYVELPYTPTTCVQESHFLSDPCTDEIAGLLDDRFGLDMDPYLCSYVVVDGPDVGVECPITAPATVARIDPPCPIPFTGLWLTGDAIPRLNWLHVICAASYDVVRGDVGDLAAGPSGIDLGDVTCLANDVPQADWWYVTGPADAEAPPVGRAFFYKARAAGPPSRGGSYGQSSDGREEFPFAGDCPL